MKVSEVAYHTWEGRDYWVFAPCPETGEARVAVYVLAEEGFEVALAHTLAAVEGAIRKGGLSPFLVVGIPSHDWNGEFTPWEAPALGKKGEPFSGGGSTFLAYLQNQFMPHIEKTYGLAGDGTHRALLGYSLGGLFALWAALETGDFSRVGSCSGSLWYDGFLAYAKGRQLPHLSRVYLSLGLSEGKARNPRMAAVEDATRKTAALLEENEAVSHVALQWEEGGHFTDVSERLLRALWWLMEK